MPSFLARSALRFLSFFSASGFCFVMALGFCLKRGVPVRFQAWVMSHFSLHSISRL